MLDSLKKTGKNISREINRAWDNLSEGWNELFNRSGNALTRFTRRKVNAPDDRADLALLPSWSLLAGELEETGKDVVVRVELPGMDKDNCSVTIEGNVLYVSGEKRFERETTDSTYHLMERAYGAFRRSIVLPRNVDTAKAKASFKNGVLTVRLPKQGGNEARTIPVS